MIDHVLGRPSSQFRKYQVFAVVSFWSLYLLRGDKHGPPGLRQLSQRLGLRFTPWQSTVITLMWLYVCRNFAKIVGLESPEPLANLYSRAYFRATWITTALDAGFWSAMKIRNKYIRDLASIIFTVYYLIAAEQADEKVRRVRAVLTVDHLRVSWNKPTTPYLYWLTSLLRPKFTKYKPRRIRIPRPKISSYKEPITGWMYFNGTLAELKQQKNLVLDVPGGGFVAMDPRTSDDKLLAWAGKTNLPILSLDYRKAPEYPYPYALNECFDVYVQIVATRGRCVGMEPESCPRIVLTGDSAGGNLATGVALKIIEHNINGDPRRILPSPAGLVLMYPALDMNIGSWMTDDQMALIRNPRTAKKHEDFVKRKSFDIDRRYTPNTPRPADDEDDEQERNHDFFAPRQKTNDQESKEKQKTEDVEAQKTAIATSKPQKLKTRLAVSSIISYFGDRILTPEMMRAMIILYVGPYNRPDFTTDHLLCPRVAPESLLVKLPKIYILTGERDPLVDDTVIFAGRLRQAKLQLFRDRQEVGLEKSTAEFNEKDHVEVTLIPGISHGFVQFVSIFPEGWKHIFRCGNWISEIFNKGPHAMEGVSIERRIRNGSLGLPNGLGSGVTAASANGSGLDLMSTTGSAHIRHHRRMATGESEGDDDDAPLAMSKIRGDTPGSSADQQAKTNGRISADRSPSHHNHTHHPQSQNESATSAGRGRGRRRDSDPHRPVTDRSKSMISLGSEEDLLKRRMKGLTVSLMGSD